MQSNNRHGSVIDATDGLTPPGGIDVPRQTQTFIAALRHDRLGAPWVIDGPINRDLFDLCIKTQLALTLEPGDVVILDNLSVHKSPRAAQTLREIGCWFLPLPPCSPDPCVSKNSPLDCFLHAPHPSRWPSPG